MKKIIVAALSLIMIIAMIVPAGAATVTPIVEVDFNTMTALETGAKTFENGAKASIFKGSGWLPDSAALVRDGDTQVLHWTHSASDVLSGLDVANMKNLTGNQVVFSITVKFAELTKASGFVIAMVDAANKWYRDIVIRPNGSIETGYTTDANIANNVGGTKVGQITLNQYNTISVVFDRTNNKRVFYINGVMVNNSTSWATAPGAINRFKMETKKEVGNIDISIKKISVYNAEKPIEATSAEELATLKTTTKADLDAYAKLDDYREADKATVSGIIADAKTKIDAAANAEAVYAAFNAAKASIDAIGTDAEKTAAEAFAKKKTDAKAELDTLVKLDDYSAENKAKIEKIIADAKTDIDEQTDDAALDKVIKIAKNKILAVKTIAQEEAEATTATTTSAESTTTTAAEAGGCGSVVGAGAAVVAFVSVLGCAVLRKKEY